MSVRVRLESERSIQKAGTFMIQVTLKSHSNPTVRKTSCEKSDQESLFQIFCKCRICKVNANIKLEYKTNILVFKCYPVDIFTIYQIIFALYIRRATRKSATSITFILRLATSGRQLLMTTSRSMLTLKKF